MAISTKRPKIVVFSLGGTIASTTSIDGVGAIPRLTAQDLVRSVPQLSDIGEVEAVSFLQVPSGDLTLSDIASLAAAIDDALALGADGVVVTQGTDTLDETAFALDVLVQSTSPVVVTGAMRNPSVAGPDGPANLVAAVRVAASNEATGLGTLVVLNDEIHAARFVAKTHTSSPSTFRSPTVGPLGWIIEDRVRLVFRLAPLAKIKPVASSSIPAVALVKCSLGDDARLIDALSSLDYRGAVLEAFGGGHVPARLVPALETLARQMPVILSSRTGGGEVLQRTYSYPGSEMDTLSRGLISSGAMDGPKARVLLSLVLAAANDVDEARATFTKVVNSMTTSVAPSTE